MGQSIDVGVRVVVWCFGELRDDLSFWQAWAGGLAGARAALALSHFSCAAIVYDVVQICVLVWTVSFPSGSYTFWRL